MHADPPLTPPPGTILEAGPVIVHFGESTACPGVHVVNIHHRAYPELRRGGETCLAAAERLHRYLVGELGAAPDPWHRGILERVIAEVGAFLERSSEPS